MLIALDEALKRSSRLHLPPLAVGLGIYLPTATTLMITVGAIAGWVFERRARGTRDPTATRQLGVLLASGMIVGESLIGVLLAAIVVFWDAPRRSRWWEIPLPYRQFGSVAAPLHCRSWRFTPG